MTFGEQMDELHQAVRSVLAALGMADIGSDELNDLTLCIGHTESGMKRSYEGMQGRQDGKVGSLKKLKYTCHKKSGVPSTMNVSHLNPLGVAGSRESLNGGMEHSNNNTTAVDAVRDTTDQASDNHTRTRSPKEEPVQNTTSANTVATPRAVIYLVPPPTR
ncbi:hypothetical protein ACEPPN_001675 [Leptodophora sp. 'Broadleaf-Isolate-01']